MRVEQPPSCPPCALHERFRVFVDDEGVLRTDHAISAR
jgi:hypothetical protein